MSASTPVKTSSPSDSQVPLASFGSGGDSAQPSAEKMANVGDEFFSGGSGASTPERSFSRDLSENTTPFEPKHIDSTPQSGESTPEPQGSRAPDRHRESPTSSNNGASPDLGDVARQLFSL